MRLCASAQRSCSSPRCRCSCAPDPLHDGFWIDEGIAVGIASHDLADIPGLLRQDGSPPLYYLLLHGWLTLFGDGEAAARALSLVFSGDHRAPCRGGPGRRSPAGGRVIAAALAAGCPLLSYYGQEARMYTLVALLSVVAAAAFVRGRGVTLTVALVLLLYTHTWGLFLAAALAVVWLVLWRTGRAPGRDGALVGAAVALLYAPWVPSLVFQALHTGAPWSVSPSALLLAAGAVPAAVAWRARTEAVRLLALVTAVGFVLAWFGSQLEPAWSGRYLAVLYGPAALALAAATLRPAPLVLRSARAGAARFPLLTRSNVGAITVGAGIGLPKAQRSRHLDPAGAGAGPAALSAGGRGVPDAARPAARSRGHGLARRAAPASAAATRRSRCAPGDGWCSSRRSSQRSRRGRALSAAARATGAPRCAPTRSCAGWGRPRGPTRGGSAARSGPSSTK